MVADDDEYPPTVEAMELLYITSTALARKLNHYARSHDAPWLWYEPLDIGRVPAPISQQARRVAHDSMPNTRWRCSMLMR